MGAGVIGTSTVFEFIGSAGTTAMSDKTRVADTAAAGGNCGCGLCSCITWLSVGLSAAATCATCTGFLGVLAPPLPEALGSQVSLPLLSGLESWATLPIPQREGSLGHKCQWGS